MSEHDDKTTYVSGYDDKTKCVSGSDYKTNYVSGHDNKTQFMSGPDYKTTFTSGLDVESEKASTSHFANSSATKYESLLRYDSLTLKSEALDADFTIDTVVDTTNTYSQCDLTMKQVTPLGPTTSTVRSKPQSAVRSHEYCNDCRSQLIGQLIEMEANFVSSLSLAVATFARPLRGFFLKQQDFFTLFQNLEKILIISENFIRFMDNGRWSVHDLNTRIGQFYAQNLRVFCDAFAFYVAGYSASKALLGELVAHSKQFRRFLREMQSDDLTVSNLLDLPLVHMQHVIDIFERIRQFTCESKRFPSEMSHIDSVLREFKKIMANTKVPAVNIESNAMSGAKATRFFMSGRYSRSRRALTFFHYV